MVKLEGGPQQQQCSAVSTCFFKPTNRNCAKEAGVLKTSVEDKCRKWYIKQCIFQSAPSVGVKLKGKRQLGIHGLEKTPVGTFHGVQHKCQLFIKSIAKKTKSKLQWFTRYDKLTNAFIKHDEDFLPIQTSTKKLWIQQFDCNTFCIDEKNHIVWISM